MNYNRWSTTDNIPLTLVAIDIIGMPVSGITPTVSIIRQSDGYYWNGSSFISNVYSNSMSEILNGVYRYMFLQSNIATSEIYDAYYYYEGPPTIIDYEVHSVVLESSTSINVDEIVNAVWNANLLNYQGMASDYLRRVDGYISSRASSTQTMDSNLISINGQLTSGNNATLNLKQLNVVNSSGSAIVASSSGGNGSGVSISGNGTGSGILTAGGSTGHGIYATSGTGATGNGMQVESLATNGMGMYIKGKGTGDGLRSFSGSSAGGYGFYAYGQSAGIYGYGSAGNGAFFKGNSNNSGLYCLGSGTGSGIESEAGTTNGNGIYAVGRGTGHGLYAASGTGESGNGIYSQSRSTNGIGISALGTGSGQGALLTGGTTGAGALFTGGSSSGDGITAIGTGGRYDFNADIQGSLSGSVGSVISGGGGLTSEQVSHAVWDAQLINYPAIGSAGEKLNMVDAYVSSRSTYAGGAISSVTGSVGSVSGDVGGKILGGGVGVITGTGVWALDNTGNEITGITASEVESAVWNANLIDYEGGASDYLRRIDGYISYLPTTSEVTNSVWNAVISEHQILGSAGYNLGFLDGYVSSSETDLLDQTLTSGDTVDTALSRLDANVSSRAEPLDVKVYESEGE